MKLWHWLVAFFVLYELVVGASEVGAAATGNSTLASVATFPSVGSLIGGSFSTSNYAAGTVDLATGGLLYFFVLHDHLFRTLMRP